MAQALIRGVRAQAITSGGPTQDIVVPGVVDTPVAAFVLMNSATDLTGGTIERQAQQCLGLMDGSGQFCIAGQDEDALPSTNTARVGDSSNLIRMLAATPTTTDGIASATFIQGGIRLNWSQLPSKAYAISLCIWIGTNVQVQVGTATPDTTGQPAVTVPTSFEVEHVIALASENTILDQVIRDGEVLQVAHAVNDKPGVTQFSQQFRSVDGSASGNPRLRLSAVELCRTQLTGNEQTRLVAFGASSGFDIDSNGGGVGPTIIYLAVNYGGKQYQLRNEVAPTLLGVTTFATPFRASSLIGMNTAVTSAAWNATVSNDEASFTGFLTYAGEEFPGDPNSREFVNGSTSEDGSTDSSTSSRTLGETVAAISENAQVLFYRSRLSAFNLTNYALDFTVVGLENDRAFLYFALEEDNPNGSGDKPLPSMQCAGTGIVSTSGSGAQNLPSMQFAGAGVQIFAGGGDKPLGFFALAGAGTLNFVAVSDFVMPQFFGTGGGFQTFTGGTNPDTDEIPQIFRPMQFAGTGTVTLGLFEGGGDKKLGAMQCAGQGALTFSGSGDTLFPAITLAGVGSWSQGGGDAQLPAFMSNGQGAQVFAGGGDKPLGSMKFNVLPTALGAQIFEGGGDKLLGAMTMGGGTGTETFSGSGDFQIPALDPSGVGTMQPSGGGDQQFPSMLFDGAGEQIFAGSGDKALPAITKGEPQPSGFVVNFVAQDGVPKLPQFVHAGLGGQEFAGESQAELPSLMKDGAGQLVFSGGGDMSLGSMTFAGAGADVVSGSGDFQLPALQCAGTDKPLSGGSSIIASPDPDTPIQGN